MRLITLTAQQREGWRCPRELDLLLWCEEMVSSRFASASGATVRSSPRSGEHVHCSRELTLPTVDEQDARWSHLP